MYIKKILAFFMACFVFCVGVLSPVASVNVYADVADIPVAVEMWEGFQTLFFTLGVSLLATDAVDKMAQMEEADHSILALANDLDTAAAEVLKNDWNDYKENLQYGYCKISSTLWNFLKNSAYSQEIVPAITVNGMPSVLSSFYRSHAGYYLIISNAAGNSTSETWYKMLCCADNVFTVPPTLRYSGNFYSWLVVPNNATSAESLYISAYRSNSNNQMAYFIDNTSVVDMRGYTVDTWSNTINYTFTHKTTATWENNSIAGNVSESAYNNALDNIYSVDNDGYIIVDSTGTYPAVVPQAITDGLITDIDTGTLTWVDALPSLADTEIEVPQEEIMTLPELDEFVDRLDLDRIQTKFPFCIPHDIYLIASGAASVSSNAPVIHVPLHIEYNNKVYYDNPDAIVIDFNMFNPIIVIVREGFFLLFLISIFWLSIEVMQSFFQITE